MGALSLCHEISSGEAFIVPTAAQRALLGQPLIPKTEEVLDEAVDGGFKDGNEGSPVSAG
jgi:hypothetical protein